MERTHGTRMAIFAVALGVAVASVVPAPAQTPLRVNGSTTVTANIFQGKEKEIEAGTGTPIALVSNGSGKGLADLVAGRADVAMLSSPLADVAKKASVDAAGLQEFKIGLSHVLLIVHPSNPVKSLTLEQVKDIFAGKIANWKDVGGADGAIVPVVETLGGGLRATFEEKVMRGTAIAAQARAVPNGTQIPTIVKQLPTAIGLATPKTAAGGVKVVTTDDVVQPLFLVTKGAPSASVTKLIETVTKVAK